MKQPVILLAASGLAREVIAAISVSEKYEVVGVLDDNPKRHTALVSGVEVLGPISQASGFPDVEFLICAGFGSTRAKIAEHLDRQGIGDDSLATLIHPGASRSSTCSIGVGTIALAHVALTADLTVGKHVVMMPNVVVTHDGDIGDFATLASGAMLGGGVTVGSEAYLGMGCTIRENLSIGNGATVGMGAVVLQDVPKGATWVGNPARPIRGK